MRSWRANVMLSRLTGYYKGGIVKPQKAQKHTEMNCVKAQSTMNGKAKLWGLQRKGETPV